MNPSGSTDASVDLENDRQPAGVYARMLRTWPEMDR
jgi:hypothetical protein